MTVPTYHPPNPKSDQVRVLVHRRGSSLASIPQVLEEDSRGMAEPADHLTATVSEPILRDDIHLAPNINGENLHRSESAHSASGTTPTPSSPGLSRSGSFSDVDESLPPLDRLTVFDLLGNLSLPQRLEKVQNSIQRQSEKVRRSGERVKSFSGRQKDKVIEEWRRRIPNADEQLAKYKRRMTRAVDRLGGQWDTQKRISMWEKASFIAGVLNIFISGYLIGGHPEWFHYWYTAQLIYFMPIRIYTYKKRGYHYFLADLCYFVNMLCMLSIWVFPRSKRLFISTYCLAYGNNAIAIAMWRNSMVFHSLDKITSLFIHIMPPVALHCIVHLLPSDLQQTRFPAVYKIKTSQPSDPEHYSLFEMMFWASLPYAVWQLSYYFLISIRRADKIAAGRPTSFTWLRRSFAPTWIGKFVLSLPKNLQETAYMGIQYIYALLTMTPCPLWFWSRWASGIFLSVVFAYSVWNGATYYIDIFGLRFQKELEQLKKDVAKWQEQKTPELAGMNVAASPLFTPITAGDEKILGAPALAVESPEHEKTKAELERNQYPDIHGAVGPKGGPNDSLDQIPLLDVSKGSTGVQAGSGVVKERKGVHYE